MEQHTSPLQSHWHTVGLTLGCPHLASVMRTPSGQYVQLTLTVCDLFQTLVLALSILCPSARSLFILLPSPFPCICVCICFVELKDSSWTDHGALFFLPASFFLSLSLFPPLAFSLPGRVQRNWSLGGSREEPGKEGTKGRPSAAITALHLLPLFFPPLVLLSSLSPLASAPN